jgi:hypothetical protein
VTERTENEVNTDDTIARVLGLPPVMFNDSWRDGLEPVEVVQLYATITAHHPGLYDHMEIASGLTLRKAGWPE